MATTFPLQRDPEVASPTPDAAVWQREIAEAREGLRAKVSTKAAAWYLGVHPKTLLQWVRDGVGPDAVKNPSRRGTTALNQHQGFTLAALDAFTRTRTGDIITRGKRSDAETLRRAAERIQAAIDLKATEDVLAKARERARRLGVVCFSTLSDATEVQPWACIDGRVAGHAWAVDDATFEAAGEDVVEATLDEVLALHWQSDIVRQPYAEALSDVIDSASRAMKVERDRQRAFDLAEVMSEAVAKNRSCPRCGRGAHPGSSCRL